MILERLELESIGLSPYIGGKTVALWKTSLARLKARQIVRLYLLLRSATARYR